MDPRLHRRIPRRSPHQGRSPLNPSEPQKRSSSTPGRRQTDPDRPRRVWLPGSGPLVSRSSPTSRPLVPSRRWTAPGTTSRSISRWRWSPRSRACSTTWQPR